MQKQFFSSFFSASAVEAAAQAKLEQPAMVELDLATLEHVAGGKGGPAGTWVVTQPDGPAGTW